MSIWEAKARESIALHKPGDSSRVGVIHRSAGLVDLFWGFEV